MAHSSFKRSNHPFPPGVLTVLYECPTKNYGKICQPLFYTNSNAGIKILPNFIAVSACTSINYYYEIFYLLPYRNNHFCIMQQR